MERKSEGRRVKGERGSEEENGGLVVSFSPRRRGGRGVNVELRKAGKGGGDGRVLERIQKIWDWGGGDGRLAARSPLREVIQGELAVVARSEVFEGEVAEGGAVEGEDFAALAGEHAADLVVASLGEDEFGGGWIQDTELGGEAGGFLAGEEEGAAGEEFSESGGHGAVEGGAVELGDFVFWRREAVDESALVGEEEEAGGVFVEAADAGDLGIAGAPAGREEAVDVGAFAFVVGADEAEGFVEEKE